jgi:hypothetical protein
VQSRASGEEEAPWLIKKHNIWNNAVKPSSAFKTAAPFRYAEAPSQTQQEKAVTTPLFLILGCFVLHMYYVKY